MPINIDKLYYSNPEPPPQDCGEEVTPILLVWLQNLKVGGVEYHGDINANDVDLAIELIKARDAYGFDKYGQHLKTGDGRDSQEDAIQELGDLLQYLLKAMLNGENVEKIKRLLPILIKLLESAA